MCGRCGGCKRGGVRARRGGADDELQPQPEPEYQPQPQMDMEMEDGVEAEEEMGDDDEQQRRRRCVLEPKLEKLDDYPVAHTTLLC